MGFLFHSGGCCSYDTGDGMPGDWPPEPGCIRNRFMTESERSNEGFHVAPRADRTDAIDIAFSVPQVHRVRFTRDVFGADAAVLVDLLESSDGGPARVQFWLDSYVAAAQPQLTQRIHALS